MRKIKLWRGIIVFSIVVSMFTSVDFASSVFFSKWTLRKFYNTDRIQDTSRQEIDKSKVDLDRTVVLITAGGIGSRLWPLSTAEVPKQFQYLISDRSMFQLTVDRVLSLIPLERIFVITRAEWVDLVKAQYPDLPEDNIIAEPEGRDTLPAIGYASVFIENKLPDATMVLLAADQYIGQIDKFHRGIIESIEAAQNGNYLVSVGVKPTEPNTGYGIWNMEIARNLEKLFIMERGILRSRIYPRQRVLWKQVIIYGILISLFGR